MELAMLLKPAPLVVKRKGDPEQLSKDWEDYVKVFQEFLGATGVAGVHANPEVANTPCAACLKAKNMLRLVGGGPGQDSLRPCGHGRGHRQLEGDPGESVPGN